MVIGNGNYLLGSLANPENDARAMKSALQSVGFEVIEYENLNQGQMKKAIDEFGISAMRLYAKRADKLKKINFPVFLKKRSSPRSKGFCSIQFH